MREWRFANSSEWPDVYWDDPGLASLLAWMFRMDCNNTVKFFSLDVGIGMFASMLNQGSGVRACSCSHHHPRTYCIPMNMYWLKINVHDEMNWMHDDMKIVHR
jgi:hypothetical protein